ncbi:TetR/AcrR family transcriptional regulator [Dictyobacter aurantiacus]|uniref:TetR family transcriptional regulator n=1 Tax=Dictyobacter aurantiacus TaxID=1936993 RepID=A0A401ZK74_9CHLR|nr:TetR/AcrR family transcriptional regulator [Dictyobacter aurantiacus]GCE07238.1 TetR family transcriptional regulator [Dictyobacter aurantiacus]
MSRKHPTTTRLSAEERREHILEAALPIFAAYGLHGASTLTIAERAGISETYIFRLFGTKKELFLATVERVHGQIMAVYRSILESHPDQPLEAIQSAMRQAPMPKDRLLLLLQAYAACHDEEIQRVVCKRFINMYSYVAQQVGTGADVQDFFAHTMLAMITMALGILNLPPQTEEQITPPSKDG